METKFGRELKIKMRKEFKRLGILHSIPSKDLTKEEYGEALSLINKISVAMEIAFKNGKKRG